MNEPMIELLSQAIAQNASDVFITAGKPPSLRVLGEVESDPDYPPISAEAVDEFRKSIIGVDGEKKYREKGGYDASFAISPTERCRLNFFTSLSGPGFVARPIRLGASMSFENLMLPEESMAQISSLARGIVIVTGSTGSGKSTTLSAIVNYINHNFKKHIITIEDPIEYMHSDIMSLVTQREVNELGAGFPEALRNALRENPDVIVVGEMRDTETMQVAITAALTGHLVITTVHTTDAVQTVERLINMFPDQVRDQIATDLGLAIEAVISQRLVPRADEEGMIPALEIMLGTSTVKKQIAERDYGALEETIRAGVDIGMCTFNRYLFNLLSSGLITPEAAAAASSNVDELNLMIKGMDGGGANTGGASQRYSSVIGGEDKNAVDMRMLFRTAAKSGASDIVLSNTVPPTLRINGKLQPMDLPALTPMDIQRLIYSIINKRQRVTLEENRELDFAMAVTLPSNDPLQNKIVRRFRLNAFYQRNSLALVGRVIPSRIPTPEELKLPPAIIDIMGKKQGIVLVTGPTGSGKSTSLAALLNMVNRTRPCHIVTIEDPVEYVYEDMAAVIEQRELHSDTMSFAAGLKSAMRQAPDIILVGEMRDTETIASALTAAETGHLVLGTIHTNSAPQTVDRIIDSFPAEQQNQIRQQFSASLLAVMSQRLIRRADGNGRVAAFEVMIATPPVQALIREGKTHQLPSTIETSQKDGMISMDRALEELYERGLITAEDVASFKPDLKKV